VPNVSVRLSDQEVGILDEFVEAMEAYYEREGKRVPALRTIKTSRSSAFRDLLSSWKHGMNAPEVFPPVEKVKR
jgi:hypothetical protein